MKQRTKHLTVRDGNLIPLGNNFAYVLGDHPNKVDDVDIGPNNRNGLSVNHGEIMQFGRTGVRVFSAEPILNGVSPSKLVQSGVNPNAVFAAQERYKDIHHLKDDGSHAKLGDWIKGLFSKKETVANDTPEYYENINPAVATAHRVKKPNKIKSLKNYIKTGNTGNIDSNIEETILNIFDILPKKAKERAIEVAMRTTSEPTPRAVLTAYSNHLHNNKNALKNDINYILFNKSKPSLNAYNGLYSYNKDSTTINNDIIDAVSKGKKLDESIAKQINEKNYGIEDYYIRKNYPNRKIQYVQTNPPNINYNQNNIISNSIGPGHGAFKTSIPEAYIDNGGIVIEYGTRNDSTFVRGWDVYDFASPKNDKTGYKEKWIRYNNSDTTNKLIDKLDDTIYPLVIRTPWVYEKDADKIFKFGGIINNKKLGGIHIAPSKRGTLLGGETKVKNDYLTIPLKGNPLYDISGETKYFDYVTKHGPDFSTIKTTNNRPYNRYNVETAYDYFKSQGANDYQIAAFLANAIEESGIEPYALDKTGVYYGISQWDKGRYSVARKSKKDKDYSIEAESKDLNNQLMYYYNSVMNGNTTSDWNHGGKGSGYNTAADARQAFRNATSVDDAIKALVLGYVRPIGGINSYKNRAKVAEQIYKLINKQ